MKELILEVGKKYEDFVLNLRPIRPYDKYNEFDIDFFKFLSTPDLPLSTFYKFRENVYFYFEGTVLKEITVDGENVERYTIRRPNIIRNDVFSSKFISHIKN